MHENVPGLFPAPDAFRSAENGKDAVFLFFSLFSHAYLAEKCL